MLKNSRTLLKGMGMKRHYYLVVRGVKPNHISKIIIQKDFKIINFTWPCASKHL